MENKKIRVSTGVTIEVNDNGDTIVARIDDALFVNGFYDLLELMEKNQKEIECMDNGPTQYDDRQRLEFIKENTTEIMEEIDRLFDTDACRKVFCGAIPSAYAIADFFDQLVPIFNEYADARQKKIAEKYNRNRKGNNAKPYYHGKGKRK